MRILNRPMFKYGGPIKEGVMHGMRQPKKNGGKMLLVGQHPKEFRDASGREQHWWPLVYYGGAALRAAPAVWRGFKAARTFAPGNLGIKGRLKDIFLGGGRFRDYKGKVPLGGTGTTKGQLVPYGSGVDTSGKMGIWQSLKDPKRLGAAIREYPLTAAGALTLPNLAAQAAGPIAKGIGGVGRAYIDAVLPGDQSQWFKKKKEPAVTGVGGSPSLLNQKKEVDKVVDPKIAEELAKAAKNKRVQGYLDMMGYDSAKRGALDKALIDASALVQDATSEAGSLKEADWGKLINQAIQTTSKRLEKPEQIREAVGLMATKAEIEKDMKAETEAQDKLYKNLAIEKLQKELEGNSYAENKVLTAKTIPGQPGYDTAVELTEGTNFKGNLVEASDWTDSLEKIKDDPASAGLNEKQLIENYVNTLVAGKGYQDGDYTVGDNLVTIKDSLVVKVR